MFFKNEYYSLEHSLMAITLRKQMHKGCKGVADPEKIMSLAGSAQEIYLNMCFYGSKWAISVLNSVDMPL